MNTELTKSLKHNILVNLLDGAFFGLGMGFASYSTILPLFVRNMTDSAMLIGLIPAIHGAFWHLPQLLTANRVARQTRYKPMVLVLTIQERLPYLGLAWIAMSMAGFGTRTSLFLTFMMISWQSLGAGFTATAWQSLISKIIPAERRGTFFGLQASAANLLASVSAVLAGVILDRLESPWDFALCFLLTAVAMGLSWFFLAWTREPESVPVELFPGSTNFWASLGDILRRDRNFAWFLIARMLTQFGTMGYAFFTVYAVGEHGVSELEIGWMTGMLLGTQIIANPILGWIGDHWSNRGVMEIGLGAAFLCALLVWWAPSSAWFYLVFFLAGISLVAIWTIWLAIIPQFGTEAERPVYIGLANTLVAPATILAPFLGGWLADQAGFSATFLASAVGCLVSLAILHFMVMDPKKKALAISERS